MAGNLGAAGRKTPCKQYLRQRSLTLAFLHASSLAIPQFHTCVPVSYQWFASNDLVSREKVISCIVTGLFEARIPYLLLRLSYARKSIYMSLTQLSILYPVPQTTLPKPHPYFIRKETLYIACENNLCKFKAKTYPGSKLANNLQNDGHQM